MRGRLVVHVGHVLCRGDQVRIGGSTRTAREGRIACVPVDRAVADKAAVLGDGADGSRAKADHGHVAVLVYGCNVCVGAFPSDVAILCVQGQHGGLQLDRLSKLRSDSRLGELDAVDRDQLGGMHEPAVIILARYITQIGTPLVDLGIDAPDLAKVIAREGSLLLCLRIADQILRRGSLIYRGKAVFQNVAVCATRGAVQAVTFISRILFGDISRVVAVDAGGIRVDKHHSASAFAVSDDRAVDVDVSRVVAILDDCLGGIGKAAYDRIVLRGGYRHVTVVAAFDHGRIHQRADQAACNGKIILLVLGCADIAHIAAIAHVRIHIAGCRNTARTALARGTGCGHVTCIDALFHDERPRIIHTVTAVGHDTARLGVVRGAVRMDKAAVLCI